MDNHEKEKKKQKSLEHVVSPAQRSLLRELGKQFTRSPYNERTESKAQWDSVAKQLNALEGPKKIGHDWRRTWWFDNARTRRKNKDINTLKENERLKELRGGNVGRKASSFVYKAAALQTKETTEARTSEVNFNLTFNQRKTKIIDKDTLNELAAITKECNTRGQKGIKNETLIAIASTLHDIKTNNVVSDLRMVTRQKLYILLCADDYHEKLLPTSRMSITDWLLFDTVLVHESVDVIQMNDVTQVDQAPLVDLFDLVKKYNVEALVGEQLAMAWAAITLEYNKKGRMCTPMLLQRRWYQLKLATRERFLQFQSVVMNSGGNQDINLLKTRKPTPLQTAIIARFKSLVIKPFMSWEERIKHNLVILRNQFESIALRKKNMPDNISEAAIVPVPETIDLTDAAEETDSQLKPGEFETVTVKETNQNMFIDENEPCEEHEIHGVTRMNNNPLDDDNNATNEDIEMHLPYNTISVHSKPEPVLPKITNIFGNVHVPIEDLPQIGEIAEQIANKTSVIANEANELNEHIDTEEAIVDIKDEPIDINEESNQLMDVKMECEIFEDQFDQINTENDGDCRRIVAGEKKNEELKADKKLRMTPIVKTVKLEDMGISPIAVLTHVYNKALIDVIDAKSRPVKTKKDTRKNVTGVTKKVNLSSALFKKPRNCTYNSEMLSKNPDFNIVLKKLNHRFFKSDNNRLLLRACKPLCVDVSKAFESKLVNGTLYLKTDVIDSHKRKCLENNKSHSVPLSLVETNINSNIDNTTAGKAYENHSVVPIPKESVKPPHVPVSNNSNNIANVAYQKFLTQNQKDNIETPGFESNISIPDINTVDALLCIIADVENTKPSADPISLNHMGDINVQVLTETNSNNKFIAINPLPTYERAHCCWAREKIDALKTQERRVSIHNCTIRRCTCCCKHMLAAFAVNMNKKPIKQAVSQSTQTFSKKCNAPSNERETDTVKLKPECIQVNNVENNSILAKILQQNSNNPTLSYSTVVSVSNEPTGILPKTDTVKFITESRQLNKLQNSRVNGILANILQKLPELEHGCDALVMKTMLRNFSEPSIDKLVCLGQNKILLTSTKFPKHFKKFLHFQRYLEKEMTLPEGVKVILKSNGQTLLQYKLGAETNLNALARLTQLVDAFNKLNSTETVNSEQCSNNVEGDKINNINKPPNAKETNKESNTTNVNFSTGVNDEVNFQCINISNVKTINEEDFATQSGSHIQPNEKHRNNIASCLGPVLRKALTPIQLLSELKYAYSRKGLFFHLDLVDGSLIPINIRMKEKKTAIKSRKSKSVPKKTNTTERTLYNFCFEDPVTGIKRSVLLNIEPPTNNNSLENEDIQSVNKDAESMIQQPESSESITQQQESSESLIQQQESSESIKSQQLFSKSIKQEPDLEIDLNINGSKTTQLITDIRTITHESYENEPITSSTETSLEVVIKKEKA